MNKSESEKDFFEGLRRFVAEISRVERLDEKKLEQLIKLYANPNYKEDPLGNLPPEVAKRVRDTQQAIAPILSEHPFFKRVEQIAEARFSKEVQQIIDAVNYLLQTDENEGLGLKPELAPPEVAIKLVLRAREDAPRYAAQVHAAQKWDVPTPPQGRPQKRSKDIRSSDY